jgi:Leucine-rich repeat (LRR) protein
MIQLTLSLPATLLLQPWQPASLEWQVLDESPGVFTIPDGMALAVRVRNLTDDDLRQLIAEIGGCPALRLLNLSENRKITDLGMKRLTELTQLTMLNISSCDITNAGLAQLTALTRLEWLDASYLNRLTDVSIKTLRAFPRLEYVSLQGCSKMTYGGVARLRKPGLTIKRMK